MMVVKHARATVVVVVVIMTEIVPIETTYYA